MTKERQVDLGVLIEERNENPLEKVWVCVPGKDMPTFKAVGNELADQFFARVIDQERCVAYMNVGEVIDKNLQSDVALAVQGKYGPRALALMTRPATVIVGADTPQEFIKYQENLRGYKIETLVVDFNDKRVTNPILSLGQKLKDKTIKPYMPHSALYQSAKDVNADLSGFSPKALKTLEMLNDKKGIIDWLNNKKTHNSLVQLGLTLEHTSAAPHGVEVNQNDLFSAAKERLNQIEKLYNSHETQIKSFYEERGIDYVEHPPKIIIRPSWGGGSYETFTVTKMYGADGEELFKIGHEGRDYEGKTWDEVEEFMNEQFANNGASEKYTITRFAKTVEDIGINSVITVDEEIRETTFYVAPTHGIVSEGTMCVGTQSISELPESKKNSRFFDGTLASDPSARAFQHNKARMVTAFVTNKMAQDAFGNQIMGVDVMLADIFEAALAESVKGTNHQYEAVGPYIVAEANMRPTQRTMHQKTQLSIIQHVNAKQDTPISIGQLIESYEDIGNHKREFASHDAMHVTRKGWELLMNMAENNDESTENILAGINGKAEGVYFIMPPVKWNSETNTSTMGIGVMAKTQEEVQKYWEKLVNIANGVEHTAPDTVDLL